VCIDLGLENEDTDTDTAKHTPSTIPMIKETVTDGSSEGISEHKDSKKDRKRRLPSEKENRSLCKQLCLSYNVLKNASKPVHLHITSYDEKSFVGSILKQQGGEFECEGQTLQCM
jgi:hypothetical protein